MFGLGILAGKLVKSVLVKKLKGAVPDEVLAVVDDITDDDVEEAKEDPELKTVFADFTQGQLDYFGRYEDLPMFAQCARALMRPYVVAMTSTAFTGVICYLMIAEVMTPAEGLAYLSGPVGLAIGFLFGEKRDSK